MVKQKGNKVSEKLKLLLAESEDFKNELTSNDEKYFEDLEQKRRLRTGFAFLDDPTNKKTGIYEQEIIIIAGNRESQYKTDFSINLACNLANTYKKRIIYYLNEPDGEFSPVKMKRYLSAKKFSMDNVRKLSFKNIDNLITRLRVLKEEFNEKDIVFINNFANRTLTDLPGSNNTYKRNNLYSLLTKELKQIQEEKKVTFIIITNRTKAPSNSLIEEDIQGGTNLKCVTSTYIYVKNTKDKNERIIMRVERKASDYLKDTLTEMDPNTYEFKEK